MSASLECRGVSVDYGRMRALNRLDLSVGEGETVALLGPSGSGKSTLVYAIAGFVPLSEGEIHLSGRPVATPDGGRPPHERGVAVVFQNYALWPHMSAVEAVAYPIRRSGEAKEAAREEARAIMERLGIGELAERRPSQLSGGEQQRVGMARALARRAGLLLLDEPTAHLDASVKAAVQSEVARARAETRAAALYATHDAAEALALADRVALIREGSIVQEGTPREVYERPVDRWAAELTGRVSVLGGHSDGSVVTIGRVPVPVKSEDLPSGPVEVLVRPDWVVPDGPLPGVVRRVMFRGSFTDYVLDTRAGELLARVSGPPLHTGAETSFWTVKEGWVTPGSGEPPT